MNCRQECAASIFLAIAKGGFRLVGEDYVHLRIAGISFVYSIYKWIWLTVK